MPNCVPPLPTVKCGAPRLPIVTLVTPLLPRFNRSPLPRLILLRILNSIDFFPLEGQTIVQQFFVIFYDMRYPHDPCSLHQITSRPLIRRNCGSSDSSESSPPIIIPLTSSSHCEATYSFSTRLSDRTSTSSFSLASSWKAETFDSLSAALAGLIRTSCRSWSVVIAFVASSIAVYSLPALNSESVVSALASSRASWTARGVHEVRLRFSSSGGGSCCLLGSSLGRLGHYRHLSAVFWTSVVTSPLGLSWLGLLGLDWTWT